MCIRDRSDTGEEIAHAIDMAEQAARAAKPDMKLLMYLEPDIDLGRVGSRIGHRSSAVHTDLPDERVNDGGSTQHGATRIEGRSSESIASLSVFREPPRFL